METITHVAYKSVKGGIFSAAKPFRHDEVVRIALMTDSRPLTGTMGFLTSTGRFVDRQEGAKVAKKAKQYLPGIKPGKTLISEDIW